MTTFTSGATSVTVAIGPLLPLSLTTPAPQLSGIASDGSRYVYGRPVATRPVSLTFPAVTDAERTALEGFIAATIAGARTPFTWTDSAAADHSVRYVSHTIQRHGADWHRVDLSLLETL